MILERILQYNRIAIVGTHGIGKTTLARFICETFGFRPIRECARELLDEKGTWWNDLDKETIAYFQTAIANMHLFLTSRQDRFVADRSLLDHLAYIEHHIEVNGNWSLQPLASEIRKWAAQSMLDWYDLLIYYSPMLIQTSPEQDAIDVRIKRLLDHYCPSYMTIERRDADSLMKQSSYAFTRAKLGVAD